MREHLADVDHVEVAHAAEAELQPTGCRAGRIDAEQAVAEPVLEQARLETDLEKAAELFIQLNDILINDVVMVPIVNRASDKEGVSTTLVAENIAESDFSYAYWNIANWNRKA